MANNVDNITTAYRTSNLATKSLLTLLDRSNDTNVQSKFSNFLFNITQEPIEGHLALDLITTYLATAKPYPVLAQNLPNVFTALADHVVSASDKDTSDTKVLWQDAYNPLAMELHQNFKTFLTLASNSTTRDALHRIAQVIRRDSNAPADNASNLLLAICGDQEAFKKVVEPCQSESMDGPHSIALDYLKTVQGVDVSNIPQSIHAHVDNATYAPNTSTWSILNSCALDMKPRAAQSCDKLNHAVPLFG